VPAGHAFVLYTFQAELAGTVTALPPTTVPVGEFGVMVKMMLPEPALWM